MNSTILNNASIGNNCIIGAGALILENTKIPDNSIAVGSPAKVIKEVSGEHLKNIKNNATHYAELAKKTLKKNI